jgi:membrane protein
MKPHPYRRDARRPYPIPLKGWRQVAERVWSESSRDNLSVIAAGCAFYALFAIFPGLSALISLYRLTADPTTIVQQVGGFASVLPAEAYNLVIGQVHRLAESSGKLLGWSFVVSLALSIWSVMSLTQAMFAALNIAYDEPECRGLLHYYLSAFIFALLGIVGGVIVLLAIVYVPILFDYAGYSQQFEFIVRVARGLCSRSWCSVFSQCSTASAHVALLRSGSGSARARYSPPWFGCSLPPPFRSTSRTSPV